VNFQSVREGARHLFQGLLKWFDPLDLFANLPFKTREKQASCQELYRSAKSHGRAGLAGSDPRLIEKREVDI
jgi:hypothetical protein